MYEVGITVCKQFIVKAFHLSVYVEYISNKFVEQSYWFLVEIRTFSIRFDVATFLFIWFGIF
jgi:hypothetical protein